MTEKMGKGRSGIADLYPLTPLQQGLWFYALLDPASGMYFEQSVLRIEGFLNRDVFRRAWEEVLAQHAILRTGIIWEGLEHPLQLVRSKVELPWAMPQIMAGLNQTIMLSLSMVVIAALVGANGLGVPVVRALNSVNAALGFESGFIIVVVAILLDRMLRVSR